MRIDDAHDNLIGGTEAGAGNVISGNVLGGVSMFESNATGNQVQGNFIGTNAAGSAALGNSADGVLITLGAKNNTIGGATPAARNIISGNKGMGGVRLNAGGTTGNKVQGNFIGTDVTGTTDLGNDFSGVVLETSASGNTIGGSGGAGNTIAFKSIGVSIQSASVTGSSVLSNSIHSNDGIGINLSGGNENSAGVTSNDAGDADTGPNNLQNFPALTSANNAGGATLINGTLNSTPNTTFHIEVFSNPSCDPSGHGEGHKLIGAQDVTTNSGGNASLVAAAPSSVLSGNFFTATATDPTGNTSEFSQCVQLSSSIGMVQFGETSFSVQEDCAEVVVNVSRSGDVTNAATVDYATQDGSSTERTDFTTARGTLHFETGETAKSFVALITEDSHVEGSESFSVTLSNASGAVIGIPLTATIEIVDDQPEQTANPVDLSGQFVCQHYADFLNRHPDTAGLKFWTNQVEQCGQNQQCIAAMRVNVSAAFFLSIEFQETGFFVIRLQRSAFGRKSDTASTRIAYNELIEDGRQVGEGVIVGHAGFEQVLEANKQAYAEVVVGSSEFVTKYPLSQTVEQYV
ncbi:MAG: Calx-beta domain-containing protein, partial [Pyrinomonadaceae bacterium]